MPDKRYYMACLDLEGRSRLVAGGGPVALEKALGPLECGAHVTVVAPQAVPELQAPPVGSLAARLCELRPWARSHFPTYAERRDFFARLVDEELA